MFSFDITGATLHSEQAQGEWQGLWLFVPAAPHHTRVQSPVNLCLGQVGRPVQKAAQEQSCQKVHRGRSRQ